MAQESQEGEMKSRIFPEPGDILEENCPRTDFKAHYIVLSCIGDKHVSTHGNSYKLYTLYVESSCETDKALQGSIDTVYNLEINNHRGEWSIIS